MTSKFQKEIQSLIDNKVISQETANRIDNFYTSKVEDKPNRLFTIFGVLGSLLVGLGIILILAHNWDNFSKSIKTLLAFIPLLIGQFFVGFSIFKKKSIAWREGSGTFLFFAVGACIALISQIYNLPGNLNDYLLTWTLLCIPLVYLLSSNTIMLLCLVFITYYGINYGYGFLTKSNTPWWYLIMMVTLLPFYYSILKAKSNSNMESLFNWLFPLSLTIMLGAYVDSNFEYGFLLYVLLFGLFYNLGKLPFFFNQKLRRNGYLVLGSLGTVTILLITSFQFLWKEIFASDYHFSIQEVSMSILLFLVSLSLFFSPRLNKKSTEFTLFQIVFVFFSILFFLSYSDATLPTVLINILLLILGINAIMIGARTFHFGVLNYGLLIITALVVCRFFDTEMSFVIRGLLFVSVGAGFFATNYILHKRQKKRHDSALK